MDTRVEVRDEDGHIVTEGEGQVFIGGTPPTGTNTHAKILWYLTYRTWIMSLDVAGGEERVCLLDHEDTVVPGTMRATGDWVDVRDAQLCFLGRRDRRIKRHGKRVNLDSVQQVRCFLFHVSSFIIFCKSVVFVFAQLSS